MKYKNLVFLFFFYLAIVPLAQGQSPTPYDLQRQKVNSLLQQRSEKFGQYDKSLLSRTGIFGFQTKKDVKNSNEILRQIVLNDNAIFTELKILLDYKEAVSQQFEQEATDKKDRIVLYQQTIKRLQDQNEVLKIKLEDENKADGFKFFLIILLLFGLIGIGIMYYQKSKLLIKQNNL